MTMTGERAIIEVERLSKIYGVLPALQGVNFSVARGEFVALLGANGSGKSTLLRLLSGLSKPSAGTVLIGGWELPREAMAIRTQIGLVAHRPLLYENLTARENLAFFGRMYGMQKTECEARGKTLLRQVGLARRVDTLVRTFSRGMKQRLSIARALLHEPDVLLLDEPYSGLDRSVAESLDDLLAAAQQEGRTIILSTHQLERLPPTAGRALILSRGQVAYDGAIEASELAVIYQSASV